MDKIIYFPVKPKRKPFSAKDVDTIGILTKDDRDLYIENKDDISKLISFIIREKITIYEEK